MYDQSMLMNFKIPVSLKNQFQNSCRSIQSNMTVEINRMIRDFVKKAHEEDQEPITWLSSNQHWHRWWSAIAQRRNKTSSRHYRIRTFVRSRLSSHMIKQGNRSWSKRQSRSAQDQEMSRSYWWGPNEIVSPVYQRTRPDQRTADP